ncbi:MAG: hypothetical protein IT294_00225 [Deltaproteobacteria bacterium]|nr:hypothetical protein [Deltaproteobacteria bacterium]
MRVGVEDVQRHVDGEVTLRGWLYDRRSRNKRHFLQVRDGTGTIQCVVFVKDEAPEVFERAGRVPQESSLFEVGSFDDKAYLTQSEQLSMEAGAMAFGKVYRFGPTFRAEKSKTRRHLSERDPRRPAARPLRSRGCSSG